MAGKGKRKGGGEAMGTKTHKLPNCPIHFEDVQSSPFTYLSEVKDPAGRFQHLQDIKHLRLSQPLESTGRMNAVCNQLKDTWEKDVDGYHRACYSEFNKN